MKKGVLSQFRHQHFLLFLIAHFQKAALLMFADRLVQALRKLDINDPESVKRFKRAIRQNFEIFLRFTHRYWFHEVADQAQAKALFRLAAQHLDLDPLYAEVKERIYDMNEYLDSDSLRRQANTVLRLTVVTTFGLIGTVATGFLGMNFFADADKPPGGETPVPVAGPGTDDRHDCLHGGPVQSAFRLPRSPVGRAAQCVGEVPRPACSVPKTPARAEATALSLARLSDPRDCAARRRRNQGRLADRLYFILTVTPDAEPAFSCRPFEVVPIVMITPFWFFRCKVPAPPPAAPLTLNAV